jgi:Uma2 family endonuclease
MASNPAARLTTAQYLELERAAAEKHEFIDGEMVAMAGGSPKHALITMNIGGTLHGALRGKGCLTFSSDARVSIHWEKLIAYPDVTVVCAPPEFTDNKRDTLTNPTVLVEVLSPSTRNYDRGEKAGLFRQMPSLREFLLVDQEPVFVEHYRRLADGTWQIIVHREAGDIVRLDSIGCQLPIADVYEGAGLL